MKVYVIRHGLTELNKKKKVNGEIDEPLASEGIEQAKTATSLLPKTIKHIYSSPMLRAKQTARILNSELNLPIFEHQNLTEIKMGFLAGKAWTELKEGLELKKKHRSVQFDYRSYGGESASEVKRRVLEFLKEINGKYKDHEALIVAHGGIIRVLHFLETGEELLNDIGHISPHIFDLRKILKRSNS